MCSKCGTIVPKTMNDRIHDCFICRLKINRDKNASFNILRLGLESLHYTDKVCMMLKAPLIYHGE